MIVVVIEDLFYTLARGVVSKKCVVAELNNEREESTSTMSLPSARKYFTFDTLTKTSH